MKRFIALFNSKPIYFRPRRMRTTAVVLDRVKISLNCLNNLTCHPYRLLCVSLIW